MEHSSRSRLVWLFPAAIVAASAIAVGTTLLRTPPGVHVILVNHGPQTLPKVALHVTGRVHSLGDVAPGQSVTRKVLPTGESGLEVEFDDPSGRRTRLKVDCRFKDTDHGRIRVDVRDGRVAELDQFLRKGP